MPPTFTEHALDTRAILKAVSERCDPMAATGCSLVERPIEPPLVAVAIGKAAALMAQGCRLGATLTSRPIPIFVPSDPPEPEEGCEVFRGDHPLPTQRSVAAAEALVRHIEWLKTERPAPVILLALSGGASATVTLPAPGLTVADVRAVSEALMRAGASIAELNTVRKHIDLLKGGRLAALAWPLRIYALILSDVVGDDESVIGSGPVSPDPTTFADALDVLDRFGCRDASAAVTAHLESGARGGPDAPEETPKRGDPALSRVTTRIVASNAVAVAAAAEAARFRGFGVAQERQGVTGEARLVAEALARSVRSLAPAQRPACIIYGGETTVTVGSARGKGGRNQELALAAAIALDGVPNVVLLAYATDGVDGPTDAAGAVVTGETCARARSLGLDPAAALRDHDSYTLLDSLGCLIRTGPTGTNVNDIVVALAY